MRAPLELYRHSLALLTDFYQLTMAYAAWKTGHAEHEAVFHLFFRKSPFRGGYAVACGIEPAIDYAAGVRFDEADLEYLAAQRCPDGAPLFEPGFLEYLRALRPACEIDAVLEGTVVFPHEPLLRVRGPMLQCMLLETPLLNLVNFQTLIATKAARLCDAAAGMPVIEFGLRRAQGPDGALSASRAAFVGGCEATSNTLAGRLFGIPVRGTHAHSWVMLHDSEPEAFSAYARALPGNCTFLVDTYDTLQGVRHAIEVGRWLRDQGKELLGVRLDSGDLAWLSAEARRLLDEAGFPKAQIFASNDLDEHLIESLRHQGAQIAAWGVGTRLATGHDEPALGGVYKLSAVRAGPSQPWRYRIKLSEQAIKVSTPGILQVRRFEQDGLAYADMLFDLELGAPRPPTIVDPMDHTRRRVIPEGLHAEDLLRPAVRQGRRTFDPPALADSRARAQAQRSRLHAGIKRLLHPHQYPVGLELGLHELKTRLILAARSAPGPAT